MSRTNISNSKALRAYKRFSEFCKLMMAGFSAILFFSYDKIECDGLKITEGILAALGIILASASFMAYTRAADHIEIEMDEKIGAPMLLASYKNANATIDKFDRGLYRVTIGLLAISSALFIFNPLLCGKEDKTERVKNVLNTYQNFSRQDSANTAQKQSVATNFTPACKQAMQYGLCACKANEQIKRSNCTPRCKKAMQHGLCGCKK